MPPAKRGVWLLRRLQKDTALRNSQAMKGSVRGSFHGDAAACCKLCSSNNACAAITWFTGTCFLHPTGEPTGPFSHAEGKVSGIVRPGTVPKPAPLPPPPPPPPPQPIKPAPKGAKNVLFLISDVRKLPFFILEVTLARFSRLIRGLQSYA